MLSGKHLNLRSIGILMIFLLALTRLERFVRPLWNNVFWGGVEWEYRLTQLAPQSDSLSSDWPYRLFWSVTVLIVWSLILLMLVRLNRLRSMNFFILNFYASIGWGIITNLALNILGLNLNRYVTIGILMLPLCLHIIYKSLYPSCKEHPTPLDDIDRPKIWYNGVYYVVLILFIVQLANTFLWVVLMRGPAAGDEISGWFTPAKMLHQMGLTDYLLDFGRSNIEPDYAFITTLLLFFVPAESFTSAAHATPFIQGTMLMLIMLTIHRRMSRVHLTVYIIFFQLFLFSGLWIFTMLFLLWFSEPMAICMITLMFIALDPDTHRDFGNDGLRSLLPGLIQLFGIGACVALSKPPVSKLVLPAIIPALLLVGPLVYQNNKKQFFYQVLCFGLGCLSAMLLWKANLSWADRSTFYPINYAKIFQSVDIAIAWEVTINFAAHYGHCWIPLLILIPTAILWDRRHSVFILITIGLMLSILVLYSTLWQHIETKSGGRYMLHCAYGWMFYFFAKHRDAVSNIIGDMVKALIDRCDRFILVKR